MANLPSYLSGSLGKSNKINTSMRSVSNLSLCAAVFLALTTCSLQSQASQNDSDGDGLSDTYELKIGSESYLSDTDGDEIKDGDEIGSNPDKPLDSDNDGVIDVLDDDDDNDGLPSYLESKNDSDNDGLLDYLDTDSDNDGVADGEEAGFLNQDKNLDGVDDAFDTARAGAVDTNGDGIDDNVTLPDHNNDGKPDYLDPEFQHQKQILVKKKKSKSPLRVITKETVESKNLGSKKIVVMPTKTIEIAKNKKKIVQASKSSSKPNNLINNNDANLDSDNDGLSNALEKILGTNHLNRDTDGDKVSDAVEIGLDVNSPQDSDRDGIIDALDDDDDNDGILTKYEDLNKDSTAINDDTDSDGVPNYLDANDDGDELLTKAEGSVADSDNDGILDYLDKDDGAKNQSNASNTMKVINNKDIAKEPEVVVLFDGNAAALVAEEELELEQDEPLNLVEGILKNTQLDNIQSDSLPSQNAKNDNSVESENEKSQSQIQASTTSSKRSSHWNLF